MSEQTTRLIDAFDVADLLHMAKRQVVALARKGVIPHFALPNGEYRFDAEEVRRWLEAHKREVTT